MQRHKPAQSLAETATYDKIAGERASEREQPETAKANIIVPVGRLDPAQTEQLLWTGRRHHQVLYTHTHKQASNN
jgi:hypothetical protein